MSFRGRLFIFFTIIVIVPIAAIAFYDRGGKRVAYAKRAPALAYATAAPTTAKGKRVGMLAVSRTGASDFARSVKRLTGLDTQVTAAGVKVATSGKAAGRSR